MPEATTVADRTIAATIYVTCLTAGLLAGHPAAPVALVSAVLAVAWYGWIRLVRLTDRPGGIQHG